MPLKSVLIFIDLIHFFLCYHVYFKILIFDFSFLLTTITSTFTNSQSSPKPKKNYTTQHVKIKSLLHDLHPAFVQYCVCTYLTCRPRDQTLWVLSFFLSSTYYTFSRKPSALCKSKIVKIKADICLSTLLSWTCRIALAHRDITM